MTIVEKLDKTYVSENNPPILFVNALQTLVETAFNIPSIAFEPERKGKPVEMMVDVADLSDVLNICLFMLEREAKLGRVEGIEATTNEDRVALRKIIKSAGSMLAFFERVHANGHAENLSNFHMLTWRFLIETPRYGKVNYTSSGMQVKPAYSFRRKSLAPANYNQFVEKLNSLTQVQKDILNSLAVFAPL